MEAKQRRGDGNWQVDKRVSLATGINMVQLIAVVWFGATFYTQVQSNQILTEKRFTEFTEQRKEFNDEMKNMQDAQTKLIIDMSSMSKDITTQSVSLKDISDILHAQDERGRNK